jgi:hypothetical protein
VGQGALARNTTGNYNTAVGQTALCSNTVGCGNTAQGGSALVFNTTGNYNTAQGYFALYSNTIGCDNIALGAGALYSNCSGSNNVAIGSDTLGLNTTGSGNTAIGTSSLAGNTIGNNNIGVGWCAGCAITTGTDNTILGSLPAAAGCVCTVLIGAGVCERIRVDNSGLYINNSLFTSAGSIAVTDDTTTNANYYPTMSSATSGTLSPAYISTTKLSFNPSTGQLTIVDLNSTSDRNLKDNIETIQDPVAMLLRMRGVGFNWRDTDRKSYGVVAQELEQILPELVHTNPENFKTVNYLPLIAFLIEAVKQQQTQIDALVEKIS